MDREITSNPYLEGLIALIEERERQLELDQDEEKRREYYQLLFRLFLFHLEKGHRHNAIGAMGKNVDSLKTKVHSLFYEELLPLHDRHGLSARANDRNFALLATYAAAQTVKGYM